MSEDKKENTPKESENNKDTQKNDGAKNKAESKSKKPTPTVKKKNIFQKHPFVFILLTALIIAVV